MIYRAIVTREGIPTLSNGTSFNDLELPLTEISRSPHYSTSSGRLINSKLYAIEWSPFSMILNDSTHISRCRRYLMLNVSERYEIHSCDGIVIANYTMS